MSQSSSFSRLDRARFQACWRSVGAHNDAAVDVLTRAYSEPHRYYHTARHISECLAWFDTARSLAEHPDEVEVALFFHDLVYEPSAGDNEAASVARFRRLALDAGVQEAAAARIERLIKATASHAHGCGDTALVVDLDLSILGAPPTRYTQYERDIRREYASFSDLQYEAGRARFLRSFLERDQIYSTPKFAELLEARARANLTNVLAALRMTSKEGDDV